MHVKRIILNRENLYRTGIFEFIQDVVFPSDDTEIPFCSIKEPTNDSD